MADLSENEQRIQNGTYSEKHRKYVVRKLLEFLLKHPSRLGSKAQQTKAQNFVVVDTAQEEHVGQLDEEGAG